MKDMQCTTPAEIAIVLAIGDYLRGEGDNPDDLNLPYNLFSTFDFNELVESVPQHPWAAPRALRGSLGGLVAGGLVWVEDYQVNFDPTQHFLNLTPAGVEEYWRLMAMADEVAKMVEGMEQ